MAVNRRNTSPRRSKFNKAELVQRRQNKIAAGVSMKVFQEFNDDDVIESNIAKGVTSALFTNDSDSTLTTFFSASTMNAADYFLNVYSVDPAVYTSAQPQFAVAYGHYLGYGTVTASGASTASMTPSKAVYTQFANILLEPGDDKFTINGSDENGMMFIVINRARYKERMNPGGWELNIRSVDFIDDSPTVSATAKNGKLVYNIIKKGTTNKVGLFYPEIGVLAFGIAATDAQGMNSITQQEATDNNVITALFTELKTGGPSFKARAEEDITSTHYFCRVRNQDYNFSNNQTFVTTSNNLRHAEMIKDPQVYVTTVGLYTEENELVAVAKLSKPLLKNFTREATVRVKLDY